MHEGSPLSGFHSHATYLSRAPSRRAGSSGTTWAVEKYLLFYYICRGETIVFRSVQSFASSLSGDRDNGQPTWYIGTYHRYSTHRYVGTVLRVHHNNNPLHMYIHNWPCRRRRCLALNLLRMSRRKKKGMMCKKEPVCSEMRRMDGMEGHGTVGILENLQYPCRAKVRLSYRSYTRVHRGQEYLRRLCAYGRYRHAGCRRKTGFFSAVVEAGPVSCQQHS